EGDVGYAVRRVEEIPCLGELDNPRGLSLVAALLRLLAQGSLDLLARSEQDAREAPGVAATGVRVDLAHQRLVLPWIPQGARLVGIHVPVLGLQGGHQPLWRASRLQGHEFHAGLL